MGSAAWTKDAAQVFCWAMVAAGPLPLGLAWIVSRRRELADAPPGWALAVVGVWWWAAQITLGLLLAGCGWLRPAGVLGGEMALLAAGALALRRSVRAEGFASLHHLLLPRGAATPVQAGLLVCGLVLALTATAHVVTQPTSNFDSRAYHLPLIARWVDSGRLTLIPELGQPARYPHGVELVSALLVTPARNDLGVALPMVGAWTLLGLAAYLLGRRLGAGPTPALAAALTAVAVPAVLERVEAIQPDIALAAFVGLQLLFAARARAARSGIDQACAVLAAGLVCGVKMSGPVYAAMAAGTAWLWGRGVVPGAGATARPAGSTRPLGGQMVVAALIAAVIGGTWYARNLLEVGSLLGHVRVAAPGIAAVAHGPAPLSVAALYRTTLAGVFSPRVMEHWRLLARGLCGAAGPPGIVLGLVAALGLAGRLKRRPPGQADAGLSAASPGGGWPVAGFAVTCAVAYWWSPYGGDNGATGKGLTPWFIVGVRYAFPMLPALAALAAATITRWPHGRAPDERWLLPIPAATAAWGGVTSLQPEAWPLWSATALAVPLGALLLKGRLSGRRGAALTVAIAGLAVLAAAALAHPARLQRERERTLVYGEIVGIVDDTVRGHAALGIVNVQDLWPFVGAGFARHAEWVAPRPEEQPQAWGQRVRRAGVTWVLLGDGLPGPEAAAARQVRAWADAAVAGIELVRGQQSLRKDLTLIRVR